MTTAGPATSHRDLLRAKLPQVPGLVDLAVRGLGRLGPAAAADVPFTWRGAAGSGGPSASPEGTSLRYAAIAALGISRLEDGAQRAVLGGRTAADFALECQEAALRWDEAGATALALWAAAEVAARPDTGLLAALDAALDGPVDTVVAAWIAIAAVAVGPEAERLGSRAADRLLEHQGPAGIFPHRLPPRPGVRGHVGSFADQIYPVQAFARLAAATGERKHLTIANRTAGLLVELQGQAGQWWWHYDHRDGTVVERFPVYSVHQHGMAPMVLFELAEAGGADHTAAVASGVRWLGTHPECVEPLVAPDLGLVWRKVGRREPGKASRGLAAATTALRPGLHLPGLDRLLPPGRVDYECRPYELGWLLYAWGDRRTEIGDE